MLDTVAHECGVRGCLWSRASPRRHPGVRLVVSVITESALSCTLHCPVVGEGVLHRGGGGFPRVRRKGYVVVRSVVGRDVLGRE